MGTELERPVSLEGVKHTIGLAILALVCTGATANSDLDVYNLHGAIHTVQTQSFHFPDDAAAEDPGVPGRVRIETFDKQGYKIREDEYEADGRLVRSIITERDGWRPLRITSQFPDSAQDRYSTYSWNPDGLLQEVSEYDGKGRLRLRSVVHAPDPDEEVTYAEDGSIERRLVSRHDSSQRRTVQELYEGKKLERTWVIDWPSGDKPGTDSVYAPGGHVLSRRVTLQSGGKELTKEVSAWSGQPQERTQVNDAKGRIVEFVEDSPAHYVKGTYRYNEHGDQVELGNFNRDGSLQRKVQAFYEYDAQGNWVLQSEFLVLPGSNDRRPVGRAVRVITYY